MRAINICRSTVALLMISAAGFCASLDSLVKQADAVFIGVGDQPVQIGRSVTIRLSVERVYKGDLAPGALLYVDWDAGTSAALWRTPPNLHGVWFLQSTAHGWRFISAQPQSTALADLLYPTSTGSLPTALAANPGTSVTDQLILEIANAPSGDPWTVYQATAGSSSPGAMTALRNLAQSSSTDARLFGLAGLLNRGDTAAVQQLGTDALKLNSSRNFGLIKSALGSGFRNTAPESITALGQIVQSQKQPVDLRVAAAQALSAMHTRETLPFLAALLDEQGTALLSYGVIGLGFFANGVGVQTTQGVLNHLNYRQPSSYQTAETQKYLGFDPARQFEFVDFWRRWWIANRATLTQ